MAAAFSGESGKEVRTHRLPMVALSMPISFGIGPLSLFSSNILWSTATREKGVNRANAYKEIECERIGGKAGGEKPKGGEGEGRGGGSVCCEREKRGVHAQVSQDREHANFLWD